MSRKRGLLVAPYLPFKSFLTALDHLSRGTFDPIDRTAFPSSSGTLVGQFIGALRFFGLLDDQGHRQSDLEALLNENQRRAKLKDLLESHYKFVVRDLQGMTLARLKEALEVHRVSGETAEKARAFFLNAAKYSGLTLPPQLTKQRQSTRRQGQAANPLPRLRGLGHERNVEKNEDSNSTTRTIERSGARITLSIAVDLFELAPEDREFVFKLIDAFKLPAAKKERTKDEGSAQLEFAEPDSQPWREIRKTTGERSVGPAEQGERSMASQSEDNLMIQAAHDSVEEDA